MTALVATILYYGSCTSLVKMNLKILTCRPELSTCPYSSNCDAVHESCSYMRMTIEILSGSIAMDTQQ